MNFSCEKCDRSFKWKAGLNRHQKRKTPCRKAMFICAECNKYFVSQQSLKKHKVLYCQMRGNQTPLSDILAKLIERDMVVNGRPVDDFLDIINTELLEVHTIDKSVVDITNPVEQEAEMDTFHSKDPEHNLNVLDNDNNDNINNNNDLTNDAGTIPYYFNEIISSWFSHLFMLEGKFQSSLLSYEEAFRIINRMLEDGLITTFDHGELCYTTRLFIRLCNIYEMGMVCRLREEYIDILIILFEMKKLSKEALKILLLNI